MDDERDYGYVDEGDYQELVNPSPRLRFAVFEDQGDGYSMQISRWMSRERSEDALTSLLEDGNPSVYIVSEAT